MSCGNLLQYLTYESLGEFFYLLQAANRLGCALEITTNKVYGKEAYAVENLKDVAFT